MILHYPSYICIFRSLLLYIFIGYSYYYQYVRSLHINSFTNRSLEPQFTASLFFFYTLSFILFYIIFINIFYFIKLHCLFYFIFINTLLFYCK